MITEQADAPMELTLQKSYSRKDAMGLFDQSSGIKEFCDQEYIVLKDVVLCFTSIGNPKDETYFPRPSKLTWRPKTVKKDLGDEWAWLPIEDRNVRETSRQKTRRTYHLFIRRKADEQYVYLGHAHLGSYGNAVTGHEINFFLYHKLSRELWIFFEGYPGWEVEVNHQVYHIAYEDDEALNHAMEYVYEQEYSHIIMTRYEEDSLHLHTNRHRGWLMYLRNVDDSGLYITQNELGQQEDPDEEFRCVCGISLEFPRSQTLEKNESIKVMREFFTTRCLPTRFLWKEL